MKYIKIVEFLLKNGADINAQTNLEQSALYLSVKLNNVEIVDLLLKNSANINMRDYWGWTSLHIASYHDYKNIITQLIYWNADITLKTHGGMETAFDLARPETRKFFLFLIKSKEIWVLWELD